MRGGIAGTGFADGEQPGDIAPLWYPLGRRLEKPESKASALDIRNNGTEPILALYASVRATPVPVIAIVQGEARGFGCALVGQCDLAIASENARFSMPEMDVNLPPTLAISAVLGKVPPKRLLSLVLLRNQISAREALDLGMLSDVAPAIELDSRVAETV